MNITAEDYQIYLEAWGAGKPTPLKAHRKRCLDCCCGSSKEVKLCQIVSCASWIYRFGTNPKRKGIGGKNPKFRNKVGVE